MKIADSIAFLDNRRKVQLEMLNGGNSSFIVTLNMRTELFYKVVALLTGSGSIEDAEQREVLAEIVAELLSTGGGEYSAGWVRRNFAAEVQVKFIENIFRLVNELLENDCFKLPDIKVVKSRPTTKTKDSATKERQTKRDKIERGQKMLAGKMDSYLTTDILIVSTKTNNSYFDCMDMPIFTFKSLVRNIMLNEYRADDDYEWAYLKNEAKKLSIELSDRAKNKPDAPKVDRGAELANLLVK